jgi:3-methylfumaryl-CoA hydratase
VTEARDGNTVTLVAVDPYPVAALTALFDDGLPAPGPGDPLPPCWHLAACAVPPPTGALGPDGHPRSGLVTAPPGRPRRMFAGGRLSAPGTVRVGERLDLTQRVTASADKQGRSGPLRFCTTESVFRRADGDVVLVEEQDIVYRAAGAGTAAPAQAPPARAGLGGGPGRLLTRPGDPLRAVLRADAVALQRFSAATANPHRIHYDHPYVTSVEGYPGLVVHGPLLLLSMLELIRLDLPGLVVTGVRFRAQAPVFAGDTVDLSGERQPGGVVRLTARLTVGSADPAAAHAPDAPDVMTIECVTRPADAALDRDEG